MEFQELVKRALEVRNQYEQKEIQLYGSAWTNEEIVIGFVGDVGDLAKLVLAQNGKRNIPNSKEKLAHELSDCLWSIMVLAHVHEINLENSFVKTMNDIEQHLQKAES